MSGFWYGLIAGIIVGLVIGFIIKRGKQKSWSEMTQKEKRLIIWLIGIGVILLAAGVVVALFAI
jgi:fructose-specific phosphotransferase system IIC component